MKKAKAIIVVCVLLVMTGGCLESLALIGGGAAGGMTITRILDQQQKVIQEDIEMMEAQKAELEQKLAETADEAERAKIQQQIKNAETVLADLKDADEAIARAKEGLNVNWQDPQSVIPFAGAVLMTVFGIWQRRKKKDAEEAADENYTALTEVVDGGQEFKRLMKIEPAATVDTFKTAMDDKQSPETKKMVAVIKA